MRSLTQRDTGANSRDPLALRASMPNPLDPSLPVPLYHQAYVLMREWIVAGRYPSGAQFPTEASLCEQLGVSRITIKRALSELAAEGLVTRHRGRGTLVSAPKSRGVIRAGFDEMMRSMRDIVETTDVELLREGQVIPPPEVADDLELDTRVPAHQILRRRLLEGEPYVYSVSYIPADVAAQFPENGAQQTSMLQLLINAGHPPLEAYQRMTATAADDNVAASLDLKVGAPVLRAVRVFKTAALRPVQHTTMYFRPDRYEYTLVLPAAEALD